MQRKPKIKQNTKKNRMGFIFTIQSKCSEQYKALPPEHLYNSSL